MSKVGVTADINKSTNTIFDEIAKIAEESGSFVNVKSGQPIVLEFDPNKIKIVERTFDNGTDKITSKGVEYLVKTENGVEKKFTIAISWSLSLNALLKEGYTKIKVIRMGEKLDTNYTFVPAK